MATSRAQLKSFFETGDIPTEAQFTALINSFLHPTEDQITISMIQGLSTALSGKATTTQLTALSNAIGNLTSLNTTSKTSLVAAINEVLANAGQGNTTSAVFPEAFVVNIPDNKTGIANGYQVNAGDPMASFLKAAFRKAAPATYNNPSASLNGNPGAGGYELGTNLTINLTATLYQNDAGPASAYSIKKGGVQLAATNTATDAIQITETAVVYEATVNYNEGAVKNDSLGDPSPDGRIMAGSVNSNTLIYSGFRKLFYGFSGSETRGFPGSVNNPGNGTQFTIEVPAGSTKVRIVYPASIRDIQQVLYQEDSNSNITGNFSKLAQVAVAGANNYSSINYKVFEFVPVEPFPSTVHYLITL